jgi:hypothetical protein
MGTFKLQISSELISKFDQLKKIAAQNGITLLGTAEHGDFYGRGFKGYYRREGEFIILTILATPCLVSDTEVVDKLKEYINKMT